MVDLTGLRNNLATYYNKTKNGAQPGVGNDDPATALANAAKQATADLASMDNNKDGVVSGTEFAQSLIDPSNFVGTKYKGTMAMAQLAAQKIDKNNNGIDETELMSYLLYQDSTQRAGGDKGANSNMANIDGKIDGFGQFVALRNLNYNNSAEATATANANLSSIDSTMQSFIAQKGLTLTQYSPTYVAVETAKTALAKSNEAKSELSAARVACDVALAESEKQSTYTQLDNANVIKNNAKRDADSATSAVTAAQTALTNAITPEEKATAQSNLGIATQKKTEADRIYAQAKTDYDLAKTAHQQSPGVQAYNTAIAQRNSIQAVYNAGPGPALELAAKAELPKVTAALAAATSGAKTAAAAVVSAQATFDAGPGPALAIAAKTAEEKAKAAAQNLASVTQVQNQNVTSARATLNSAQATLTSANSRLSDAKLALSNYNASGAARGGIDMSPLLAGQVSQAEANVTRAQASLTRAQTALNTAQTNRTSNINAAQVSSNAARQASTIASANAAADSSTKALADAKAASTKAQLGATTALSAVGLTLDPSDPNIANNKSILNNATFTFGSFDRSSGLQTQLTISGLQGQDRALVPIVVADSVQNIRLQGNVSNAALSMSIGTEINKSSTSTINNVILLNRFNIDQDFTNCHNTNYPSDGNLYVRHLPTDDCFVSSDKPNNASYRYSILSSGSGSYDAETAKTNFNFDGFDRSYETNTRIAQLQAMGINLNTTDPKIITAVIATQDASGTVTLKQLNPRIQQNYVNGNFQFPQTPITITVDRNVSRVNIEDITSVTPSQWYVSNNLIINASPSTIVTIPSSAADRRIIVNQ